MSNQKAFASILLNRMVYGLQAHNYAEFYSSALRIPVVTVKELQLFRNYRDQSVILFLENDFAPSEKPD